MEARAKFLAFHFLLSIFLTTLFLSIDFPIVFFLHGRLEWTPGENEILLLFKSELDGKAMDGVEGLAISFPRTPFTLAVVFFRGVAKAGIGRIFSQDLDPLERAVLKHSDFDHD